MPTQKFNTTVGTINVGTPEVLAVNIVTQPQHAAGINNVATILTELSEKIDIQKLIDLTKVNPELFWIQRLGYLIEFLGFKQLANKKFLNFSVIKTFIGPAWYLTPNINPSNEIKNGKLS